MSEIIEAELVPAVDDKLVKYASETGLEKPATETLVQAFAPVFAKARGALADAAGVAASVKDATCVTEIRKSRTCRLAIRAVRLEGETVHKKQKESALRFGRAVDGFRNILLADLEPVENALQEAEDTAERAEAARKVKLKAEREAELIPLMEGAPLAVDLATLEHGAYARLLSGAQLMRQAKIDAAAKAEADRLAKEKADREERERIAAENARLQAEAVEARRLAEVERLRIEAERAEERRKAEAEAARVAEISRKELEAIAAKAKAEREAAEKKLTEERKAATARIEAEAAKARVEREAIEARAKADAEASEKLAAKLKAELAAKFAAEAAAKAKAEAEAKAASLAARKAAEATDVRKLLTLTATLRALPLPSFADETLNQELLAEVFRLIRWINNKAEGLS